MDKAYSDDLIDYLFGNHERMDVLPWELCGSGARWEDYARYRPIDNSNGCPNCVRGLDVDPDANWCEGPKIKWLESALKVSNPNADYIKPIAVGTHFLDLPGLTGVIPLGIEYVISLPFSIIIDTSASGICCTCSSKNEIVLPTYPLLVKGSVSFREPDPCMLLHFAPGIGSVGGVACEVVSILANLAPYFLSDASAEYRNCVETVVKAAIAKSEPETAQSVCVDGRLAPNSVVDEIVREAASCFTVDLNQYTELFPDEDCDYSTSPVCTIDSDTTCCHIPEIKAQMKVSLDSPYEDFNQETATAISAGLASNTGGSSTQFLTLNSREGSTIVTIGILESDEVGSPSVSEIVTTLSNVGVGSEIGNIAVLTDMVQVEKGDDGFVDPYTARTPPPTLAPTTTEPDCFGLFCHSKG